MWEKHLFGDNISSDQGRPPPAWLWGVTCVTVSGNKNSITFVFVLRQRGWGAVEMGDCGIWIKEINVNFPK